MTVPTKYPQAAEVAIASFNYTDIASGTGISTFYAGNAGAVISGSYLLSSNAFYSDVVTKYTQGGSDVHQKINDLDFDLSPFNLPRTIKGQILVQIPMGVKAVVAGGTSNTYVNAILRKWDGTTETNIAQLSGAVLTKALTNIGDYVRDMSTILFEIPQTHFKKGETLRLTIEQWGWMATNNQSIYFFGHDPKNRSQTPNDTTIAWSTDPTILSIDVPFKLDL